jgi:hypothetical protein
MERFIVEKIAAGLRKVGKTPDMILVDVSLVGGIPENKVPENAVCGIPLVKVDLTGFIETDNKECPFIPVYGRDGDEMDMYHFRRGYEEK